MLIGIDVGGTFTDGVLFHEGKVVSSAKKPTDSKKLQESLLAVLDELLQDSEQQVDRIVLSTTLVTNLLATNRGERTALIMIPGYGLPHDAYGVSKDVYYIKGSIDFRGRQLEAVDEKEINRVIEDIRKKGINRVAVACKFANRNDSLEKQVRSLIRDRYPDIAVLISSEISGKLNFPRRAATTYFSALTSREWNDFVDQINQAFEKRKLFAEVHILKADGGTIPIELSRSSPCETVFSGPAASTMGAVALTGDSQSSVVIDIGGTTTDISLLIAGEPLYASKGARLENQYTHINAFAVKSIALGGDSAIRCPDGSINIGPDRVGPAACFGGAIPTVTDAYNIQYNLNAGDMEKSRQALAKLAQLAGLDLDALCQYIVATVTSRLKHSIHEMFQEWENEPAYKVWEVIHRRKFKLDGLIGIGAAAYAIVPALAREMAVECFIHDYSAVANALGAAVVRPTLTVSLHVDTAQNMYTVDPGGISGSFKNPRKFQLEDARRLAGDHLKEIGTARGMEKYLEEYTVLLEEQFNMIRGWDRIGKIFEVAVQVSPGFIEEYKGVSE